VVAHGLAPGRYTVLNPLAARADAAQLVPPARRERARESEVSVEFTAKHLRLLESASWRGLAVDPKRPYGVSATYEDDVAEIVGDTNLSEAEGRALHADMFYALVALLQHTDIVPGEYPRRTEPPRKSGAWDGYGWCDPYQIPLSPPGRSPWRTDAQPSGETPDTIAGVFLGRLNDGDVDRAFSGLPWSPLWDVEKDRALRDQVRAALSQYGACLGLERVKVQRPAPSLARVAYLMRLERHYLAWSLTFYRARDGWYLTALAFRADPSPLG
jgi:hypothetical protein